MYERSLENGEDSVAILELYSFMLMFYFAIDTVMYLLYSRRDYINTLKSRDVRSEAIHGTDRQYLAGARSLLSSFQGSSTILVTS